MTRLSHTYLMIETFVITINCTVFTTHRSETVPITVMQLQLAIDFLRRKRLAKLPNYHVILTSVRTCNVSVTRSYYNIQLV